MTPVEIKETREGVGISDRQFAKLLGLSGNGRTHVRRWERGEEMPSGPALGLMLFLRDYPDPDDWPKELAERIYEDE